MTSESLGPDTVAVESVPCVRTLTGLDPESVVQSVVREVQQDLIHLAGPSQGEVGDGSSTLQSQCTCAGRDGVEAESECQWAPVEVESEWAPVEALALDSSGSCYDATEEGQHWHHGPLDHQWSFPTDAQLSVLCHLAFKTEGSTP